MLNKDYSKTHQIEQYENELKLGQLALERRRAEFRFNGGGKERQPRRISTVLPPPEAVDILSTYTHKPITPSKPKAPPITVNDQIKIHPLVGTHSWVNEHGGAWRIWEYARSLPGADSGWIYQKPLTKHLVALGVNYRTILRWKEDAVGLGLLITSSIHGKPCYTIASLSTAAWKLGAQEVGNPTYLQTAPLFKKGWKQTVWEAYLLTTEGKPISQFKKHVITGVTKEAQRICERNNQHLVKRRNYAPTSFSKTHLTGLQENTKYSVFLGKHGRVIQRLPNQTFLKGSPTKDAPKGRKRKAQKQLNMLLYVEQHNASVESGSQPSQTGTQYGDTQTTYTYKPIDGEYVRLFHDNSKSVDHTIKKLSRSDIPLDEQPTEVFRIKYRGRRSNLWEPISVWEPKQ